MCITWFRRYTNNVNFFEGFFPYVSGRWCYLPVPTASMLNLVPSTRVPKTVYSCILVRVSEEMTLELPYNARTPISLHSLLDFRISLPFGCLSNTWRFFPAIFVSTKLPKFCCLRYTSKWIRILWFSANIYGDLFYSLGVKTLTIKNVPLSELHRDIFLGIGKSLKEVNFLETSLDKIPSAPFAVRADFFSAANRCFEKITCFNVSTFQNVPDLKILNLQKHFITSLSADSFPNTLQASLEKLFVVNGTVTAVNPDTFQSFKKLKFLDLHGNNVSTLQRNQFKGLKDLEYLDVSHNAIKKVDSSHFFDLTKLTHLNISHNELTDVPR